MARDENLYIKEYLDYYLKLGFEHIYIFDDNELDSNNISQAINDSYKKYVKTIIIEELLMIKELPILFVMK